MGAINLLIYILSGYGIVSLLVIIKLLVDNNAIQVSHKVNNQTFQRDLDRLERKIEIFTEQRDKLLSNQIKNLTTMQKVLSDNIDSIDVSTNITNQSGGIKEPESSQTTNTEETKDKKELLKG